MIRVTISALFALWLAASGGAGAQPLTVAAASDLQHALPEIERAHAARTGTGARLVFGSSGTLHRQIVAGAPYDVFLSADEAIAERLVAAGRAEGPARAYAVGRLVLATAAASALSLDDPAVALKDSRFKRLAIAQPDHAPYGRAAMEALAALGLAESFAPRLVLGENVSQAARFVVDGGAEAGLIALSLAKAAGPRLRYAVVPATLHAPIRQRMVVLAGARPGARVFMETVASAEGRAILARHGFEAAED